MCNLCFILSFWQGENMQGRCVLVEHMQFHGWQVSTLTHANKMARVSREKGSSPILPDGLNVCGALDSNTNLTPAENLRASLWFEKYVSSSVKTGVYIPWTRSLRGFGVRVCVCSGKLVHPFSVLNWGVWIDPYVDDSSRIPENPECESIPCCQIKKTEVSRPC